MKKWIFWRIKNSNSLEWNKSQILEEDGNMIRISVNKHTTVSSWYDINDLIIKDRTFENE